MTTVTLIESVTTTIVKSRYFPNNGTASDVGGMISARRSRNTVNDRRMDIQSVTF